METTTFNSIKAIKTHYLFEMETINSEFDSCSKLEIRKM